MDKNIIKKKPIVSVIMPVYNGEKYLREAIDSILGQTYTDFIFIIVDDGSTDNSVNIIKSYNDPRIKLIINKKNVGIADSLNTAIGTSNTKYIARMDCDDISLPNRIEKQFKFMEENQDIGVCGGFMETFRSNFSWIKKMPLKHPDIRAELPFRCPMAHPTVMIRKEILDKYNFKYDNSYDGVEDYDLWERISTVTKMENIPKILLRYRLHEDQISRTSSTKQAKVDRVKKRQYDKLHIKNNDPLSILIANHKYKIYNESALRKVVFRLYIIRLKSFIKKIIGLE